MLIFTTHNYILFTRKEIWFYNGESIQEGTYNVFSATKTTSTGNIRFLEKYATSVIDLTKSEQELFKAIHPTYRYDIRSAEKQQIEYKTFLAPSKDDCEHLVTAYNAFAKSKKMPLKNIKQFLPIQKNGGLFFTKVILNGVDISTHIYIFDKNIISLSSSFHNSNFIDDKLRSETNKYLHWKDLLLFKSMGFQQYDFGGLNEKKHPGISKFKNNFGGEKAENYRFIKTSPLIYYLINFLKKIKII